MQEDTRQDAERFASGDYPQVYTSQSNYSPTPPLPPLDYPTGLPPTQVAGPAWNQSIGVFPTPEVQGDYWPAVKSRPHVTPGPHTWEPAVNLFDYGTYWLIEAEIPGATDEDLSLTWDEGELLIEGRVRAPDSKHAYHLERRAGTFARRIRIPLQALADDAEALYRNGVLEVTVPKSHTDR